MVALWIALIWSFLGVVVISTMEKNNTDNVSAKKATMLIAASGPAMWLYTIYRCVR